MFFSEIWRERCPIIRHENSVGECVVFASFKSYDYFRERMRVLSTFKV